jgi:long-subunit acyl-CoA synthetase (AMP-forming)
MNGPLVITDATVTADEASTGSAMGFKLYGEQSNAVLNNVVMNYVGISAGFSKEWNENDVRYGLKKCDIRCLFYSRVLSETVDALKPDFSDVRFICIEDEWDNILRAGRDKFDGMFSLEAADDSSAVRIVFTSGTTSFPKAVLLNFTNIFSGWRSLGRRVSVGEDDICYLFLPLNHTYGGIFNFLYSLVFGFQVYLAGAIHKMAEEMMKIRPTIFCAVPIVLIRMEEGAKKAGVPVSALFGGRMKYLFCGGAALSDELRGAYEGCGLEVLNAYALSETSSSLSIDYPGDPVRDSAGTVFEDIEVKVVAPDPEGFGEIAVKGDNVFAGYYGDETATAAVFTDDGFFLTGDIGCIRDKHVYLKGRKDARLTFANGEKISATAVAERVKSLDDSIKSAKVYIRDNILTCDIYITGDQAADSFDKISALIDKDNQSASKYERVGNFNLYSADRLLK